MKKIILFLFVLFLLGEAYAQGGLQISTDNRFVGRTFRSYELGVFGGTSYYTGELNPRGHFRPGALHPAFGLVFRYNLNNRYSLKFNGLYGKISGDDVFSDSYLSQIRGYNFSSTIAELAGQIEFNFFNYNAVDDNPYFTPYVFVGAAAFYNSPTTNNPLKKNPGAFLPSMPFGAGLKFKFSHRFMAGLEWGLRKTFTDQLDALDNRFTDGLQSGDSKNKDWYSFAGVILTVRVGEQPNDCFKPQK